MSDIVIAGYLGFENSGDEALLEIILSEIRKRLPDKSVTVLSMRPRKTAAIYGVRAIHRYNAAAVIGEMKRSDLFVFGGGSLLQDVTSRRSLYYYLWLLRAAKRYGMRTVLLSNGIGPLTCESSRASTSRVLSDVDMITLRDTDSAQLLSEIGVRTDKMTVTADTAFLLGDAADSSGRGVDFAGMPGGSRYAVISVREWNHSPNGPVRSAARACDLLHDRGICPLLVPMQYPRDIKVLEQIAKGSSMPAYIWRAPFTAADAKGVLGGAEFAVGMRLHMLIFAAAAGIPSAGISYDPKVESFCRDMGLPCVSAAEIEDPDALCRAVGEVIDRRDALAESVSRSAAEMARRAEIGIDMLAAMSDAEYAASEMLSDATEW